MCGLAHLRNLRISDSEMSPRMCGFAILQYDLRPPLPADLRFYDLCPLPTFVLHAVNDSHWMWTEVYVGQIIVSRSIYPSHINNLYLAVFYRALRFGIRVSNIN
jgi:hypothetical protein